MRRQDTPQATGTAEERRGLHGPNTGGKQHVEGRCAKDDRARFDILDDDALAALQRRSTGGIVLVDRLEERQERRIEASAGRNLEHAGLAATGRATCRERVCQYV